MFESSLAEIPNNTIRAALYEIIETKFESKNYQIAVSSASTVGETNFIGIIQRVTFNKNGENEQNKLILKIAPQNEAHRARFYSRSVFLQEINMYNEILPFYRQFEQSKGVKKESGFIEYPKCYRTIDGESNESLFLEDLCVRGFTIIDRYTQDVTADHVYLVMQALAKLHAISFALKDQQPEKLKEIASSLEELFLRADDAFIKAYFDKQVVGIFKVLDNEEDSHLLDKMKKLFENGGMNVALECLDLEGTDPGSVICHGDAWQNNTMFKYDKNGKPIEISLLDWQVSRYASPIIDIVYFMFCCTTKELRDAHYDDFLKVYYENLSAHIRRLGSDPDKIFPYATMQEHFHKFGKFGLVLAALLLPMITKDKGRGLNLEQLADNMEKNQQNNIERNKNSSVPPNPSDKFKKRMRDVILDMEQFGYI